MAKYKSRINFGSIIAEDKEGYNLGVDAALFIREQATKDVFLPPRIGTQGKSEGGTGASEDISAGTDNKLKVSVDGGDVVSVTLAEAGKNTGDLIAAELELKINAALAADGQNSRVWVEFDTNHYVVYSQFTGLQTSVAITDGDTDNVADDLNLGTANGGTETAGTDDQDFLQYTTGGAKFEQPIESNPHRSGRFHVGIIKKKIVADFDIDCLVNMQGNAGDSLDSAVRVLKKSSFGKETVTPGLSIKYEQGPNSTYFSLVKASTIFAEYYYGGYVKDYTLTQPGDAPGTEKYTGFLKKASEAGIGKVFGAVSASASVVLQSSPYPHAERFTEDAIVMVVAPDGETITDGYDGSLKVVSSTIVTNTLVLNAPIDAEDGSYIVFWHPGAVQTTGRDNIYTDLSGSFKFSPSEPAICITNFTLGIANEHVDKTNCFGSDSNEGFIRGNRANWTHEITFDLSNDIYGKLVQASRFAGFSPVITIGDGTGRYLEINISKWIPSKPAIDIPENGTTSVTMTGMLYQSSPGLKDPITIEYK